MDEKPTEKGFSRGGYVEGPIGRMSWSTLVIPKEWVERLGARGIQFMIQKAAEREARMAREEGERATAETEGS